MIALLILVALCAAADDAAARVVQVVGPERGERDPQLQEILTSFLGIEIERAGLSPIEPRGSKADVAARPPALAELAAAHQARFVLIASYVRRGQDVYLALRWFDASSATVVASEQRLAPIDLNLDNAVSSAANALLDASGARRDRVLTAGAELPAAQPAPPVARGASRAEPSDRFISSLSFCGVLVTGYASDYFKYGLMPAFFVGYRLPFGGGVLSAGAGSGYGRFLTQGGLAGIDIEAIPIAAEARYELGSDRSVLVYFRGQAGPAVLRLKASGASQLSKVVPFGLAGIGVAVPLAGGFGLTFETSYSVYVESASPIQGFTPAVGSYVRWGK